MSDEFDLLDGSEKSNPLKQIIDTAVSIDGKVVKTAEGIVGTVSKPLAKTLVKLDGTFKNLVFGTINKVVKIK